MSSYCCCCFQTEMFEFDNFGQNYHPTFEVFLDVNIKEVRLGILDKTKGGKEVWNRRRIFLTGSHEILLLKACVGISDLGKFGSICLGAKCLGTFYVYQFLY